MATWILLTTRQRMRRASRNPRKTGLRSCRREIAGPEERRCGGENGNRESTAVAATAGALDAWKEAGRRFAMDSVREFLTGVLTLPDPSLIPFAIGLLLVPVAIYGIVRW